MHSGTFSWYCLFHVKEEAKLVRNVMRYLLFHQHQKPGVPVKRQDLTTIIMKSYKGSSRMKKLGTLIIKKAQADFASKFGMELKEISSQVHTRHGKQPGPKKSMPLCNLHVIPFDWSSSMSIDVLQSSNHQAQHWGARHLRVCQSRASL